MVEVLHGTSSASQVVFYSLFSVYSIVHVFIPLCYSLSGSVG